MQHAPLTILKPNLSMHQKRIGARGRSVEGPRELAEAQRQTEQCHVAIRTRVLQPLGALGKIALQFCDKFHATDVKVLAQFKNLGLGRVLLPERARTSLSLRLMCRVRPPRIER